MTATSATTEPSPCALCELYTNHEAHAEHAAWRDIATPEELATIAELMVEHEAQDRELDVLSARHSAFHGRAESIAKAIHDRAAKVAADKRRAAYRARIVALVGVAPADVTPEHAARLVAEYGQRASQASDDFVALQKLFGAAGLIDDPWATADDEIPF